MHQHVLKVRDVLFSNLPTLASTTCTYDPTSLAIAPGISLYSKVRGEQPATPESNAGNEDEADEGELLSICESLWKIELS